MCYKPSKYQKRIFDFITKKTGNAIIQAVAGSGKTTTIVEATKLIPAGKSAIFVAFNTNIAKELSTKLPKTVEAKTLHSLGFAVLRNNVNGKVDVDKDKIFSIIVKVLANNNIDSDNFMFKVYNSRISKLITFIKASVVDYNDYGAVVDCANEHNIEDVDEKTYNYVREVMKQSDAQKNVIDFDDMIYMPVKFNLRASTSYDYIFVDEVQDLNKSQLDLIKMICKDTTRVIAVGDRQQSIYAFRGADSNSMDNFKEYFKAKELPLSICYRCSKNVINVAKGIVPHIEASENAEDGEVSTIETDKMINDSVSGDMILCRTNAPLVKVAFTLIRQGKKAIIRGRDIAKNLVSIINRYKAKDLAQLIEKIENFRKLNSDKLVQIENGKLSKKKKGLIMAQIDGCDTILCVADQLEANASIDDLKLKIDTIFSDDCVGIVCSSIHKAKGLEADNVYIVNYDCMPHPMAKTSEEITQEMNLKYVAVTRAKKKLCLINKVEVD